MTRRWSARPRYDPWHDTHVPPSRCPAGSSNRGGQGVRGARFPIAQQRQVVDRRGARLWCCSTARTHRSASGRIWCGCSPPTPTRRRVPSASSPRCMHYCPPRRATMADSPELVAAKRLLDVAKNDGFAFERIAPGEDGPLRGVRETPVARRDLPGWVLGTELMQRHPAAPLLADRPRRPADRRTGERGCPDRPAHGAIRLDHLTPTTGQAASSHRPRSATGTVTTPAGNHRADRGSFPTTFPAHLPPLTSTNITPGSAAARPQHPPKPPERHSAHHPPTPSPSHTTTPTYPQ